MTGAAEPRAPAQVSTPRSIRLATILWLIFAFIVWNDVFDAYVRGGMYAYLTRTALWEQGLARRVTIDEMMHPAIQRGLYVATLWGLAIAATGVGAIRWVNRRARER